MGCKDGMDEHYQQQATSKEVSAATKPLRAEIALLSSIVCGLVKTHGVQYVVEAINWEDAGVTAEQFKDWAEKHAAHDVAHAVTHGTVTHETVTAFKENNSATIGIDLIPVLRPALLNYFVDPKISKPREVMMGDQTVLTAPLKFGKRMDLLAITSSEELIHTGTVDFTDCVDFAISLASITLDMGDGTGMTVSTLNEPCAVFVATDPGSFREVRIDFTKLIEFENGNNITVRVYGSVHREVGNTKLDASIVSTNIPGENIIKPVGYELKGYRINLNRRRV